MAAVEPASESIFFRVAPQPRNGSDRAGGAEWQRARMLHAITRAVSEKGYAKVTVADVVGLAGVSRRTFYEQFEDIEDCFVAAYEEATATLLGDVEATIRGAPAADWRDRFGVAIAAYLRGLASDPGVARACLVDVLGAGRRAVEARRHVYRRFVAQMRALRHGRRDGRGEIPDVQFHATVGAVGELVEQHIFERGADSLPELTPTLVRIGWALLE
jgi:AcrR family transcriptional regulator